MSPPGVTTSDINTGLILSWHEGLHEQLTARLVHHTKALVYTICWCN